MPPKHALPSEGPTSEGPSKRHTSFDSLLVVIETARNLVGVPGSNPAQVALLNLASELINSKLLDKHASTQAGGGVATVSDQVPRAGGGVIATVSADVQQPMSSDAINARVRKVYEDACPPGKHAELYRLVFMTISTTYTGLPKNVKHKSFTFRFLPGGKLLVLVRCKLGAVESLMEYISSLLGNEFHINSVDGLPGLQGDIHIPFEEVVKLLWTDLAKIGFRKRILTDGSTQIANEDTTILVSRMDPTVTRLCVVGKGEPDESVKRVNTWWRSVCEILRNSTKAGTACAAPQNTEHECSVDCMADPMTPPASEEKESAFSMAVQALARMAYPQTTDPQTTSNMEEVD